MAKFKINKEKAKVIIEEAKTIADNPLVSKVVLPVSTAGISTALAVKKITDSKKQSEEQIKNLEKLSKDIKHLSKDMKSLENKVEESNSEEEEKSVKKKKSFSIEGGGFKFRSPKSVLKEGIKKIAEDSKLRSTDENEESLKDVAIRVLPKDKYTINRNPEDIGGLCLYQLGDVIVIYSSYVTSEDLYKLNKVFDDYCRTFSNADYSSSVVNNKLIVELWVAKDSMDYLLNKLVKYGYSINILL